MGGPAIADRSQAASAGAGTISRSSSPTSAGPEPAGRIDPPWSGLFIPRLPQRAHHAEPEQREDHEREHHARADPLDHRRAIVSPPSTKMTVATDDEAKVPPRPGMGLT